MDVLVRTARPDAVVLIDCPGFNWHVAKVPPGRGAGLLLRPAAALGVGRLAGVEDAAVVRTVMTALPFEDGWYRDRGVETHYIGHPYFDEIAEQALDREFVAAQRQAGGPVVALRPGRGTRR